MAEGRDDQAEAQNRPEKGVESKYRDECKSEGCNSQTFGTGPLTGKIINIFQLPYYNPCLPPVTIFLVLHECMKLQDLFIFPFNKLT